MQELNELADKLKTALQIDYNNDGVKFLEGFIERNKVQIAKDEWDGLINSCGAFLGRSIIESYGGFWVFEESQEIAVAFDSNNKVYPFSKVRKQFDNGLGDSIHSMFAVIPRVFQLPPKTKKKWWQF